MLRECVVIRSGRRSIGLEVTPDARLIVRVPHGVSDECAREAVIRRREWIERALGRMRRRSPARRAFAAGEMLPYLGRDYALRIVEGQSAPVLFDEGFMLSSRYASVARRVLTAWYRARASRLFRDRLTSWESACGLSAAGLELSDARSRWGCCSASGGISLNWRLCMAPLDVVDYVIVHELAHLAHRNHSGGFWGLVGRLYPEFRRQRSWLKDHGHALTV